MWQEWAVALELLCLRAAERRIQLQQTEHVQGREKVERGEGGEGAGGGESEAVHKVIPPLECCQSFHQWKESLFFIVEQKSAGSISK